MNLRKRALCHVAFAAAVAIGPLFVGAARAGLDEEIVQNSKNPDLWPGMGQNLGLQRHSDLKDLNKDNVGNLQLGWSQSSGTLRGHEGQPLVIEDVGGKPMMFMESGWPNIVQALDLSDPDHPVQVWNYNKTSGRDESAVPRACCDTVNRGVVCRRQAASSVPSTASSSRSMPRPARKCGSSSTLTRTMARPITPAPIIANGQGHHRLRRR